jgi:ethanolamine-phosphate cytidylyltransferase
VEACRWVTKSVPHAPYVTFLPWISHYGCKYVVHGDDITSDSNGEDCYRYVKAAGRFKVVKRTPGISTTNLVGRMLLCTKTHFIKSLENRLSGQEGPGDADERKRTGSEMRQRIKDYATDETGLAPGSEVWYWHASRQAKERRVTRSASDDQPSPAAQKTPQANDSVRQEKGNFTKMVQGIPPRKGQRIVYVDGGFDLFSTGHIEFLEAMVKGETENARQAGWFSEDAKQQRIQEAGTDYDPVYLIAGVHDDEVINHWKGVNYPIMNIFERGLCVLQCRVRSISRSLFGALLTLK